MAYQPASWDQYFADLGVFGETKRLEFERERRDRIVQAAISGDPRRIVQGVLAEKMTSPPVISQVGTPPKQQEAESVAEFGVNTPIPPPPGHNESWYEPGAKRSQADEERYQAWVRAEQERRRNVMIGQSLAAAARYGGF